MPPVAHTDARSSDLRWPHSLGFRLALLLLLLTAALGGAAYYLSTVLLESGLQTDIETYEQAEARRLGSEIEALTQRMEATAAVLAQLAGTTAGGSALRPNPAALVQAQNLASLVAAVGIWPEPNSVDSARDRAGLYWVQSEPDQYVQKADYNDPRAVPYYREPWYTPARYLPPNRCYWTPVYEEPLVRQPIVSCAMAMRNARQVTGVVTLSIGTARLAALLEVASATSRGYGLIVDGQGQVLAASNKAATAVGQGGKARSLAELAQATPSFNPLALAVHRQGEALRQAAREKTPVEGADIIALKAATRDFSSGDADRVLSYIRWAHDGQRQQVASVSLDSDAVLGGGATAVLVPLPASGWTLIQVQPANQGLSGARQLFIETMSLAGTLALALLVVALLLVRLAVLDPLRRSVRKLAQAGQADDPLKLVLDESPRNELGALAFWINERSRQQREHLDRATAGELQLSIEARERRALTEQLTRYFERTRPAVQAISEAVLTADEQNLLEDLNPAAEQLLDLALASARGRPLAELLPAASASDASLAAAAQAVMQRGNRQDPKEVFKLRAGGRSLDVRVSLLPVRSRGNRISGCVLVLRPAQTTTSPAAQERAAIELPGRVPCEKRMAELIASSRAQPQRHCVLVADIDHLRQLNETGGRSVGDEAIGLLAALLAEQGNTSEAYHLHADRFALLLPQCETAAAHTRAQALRERSAQLRAGSGRRALGFTVSLGIESFGGEASAADALARAEDACAFAKQAGGNTVRAYDPSMPRAGRDVDDTLWVRRVREGLEQNRLHLTTQFAEAVTPDLSRPQFESLLTLEDEEGFWSNAPAFMPAAERHGLAAAVDRWHLETLCVQLAKSKAQGTMVGQVAVQLSQSSLLDPQLPDFLINLAERHKDSINAVCLMLSEASLLAYPHQSQALSSVLQAIGMAWGITDFLARDPSQLALLRQLRARWVRIDGSRFRRLHDDPVEQRMAEALLQLSRSLQQGSWVYRLEDAPMLEAWRRLNPDLLQGGAVSKASPVLFRSNRETAASR